MKAYQVTLLVIDHDELGEEGIKNTLENTKYPNWCLSPEVKEIEGVDVGEWSDDHPLNHQNTAQQEYERLFKK